MAYSFAISNSQWISATSPTSLRDEPITLACWMYNNDTTRENVLCAINNNTDSNVAGQRFFLMSARGDQTGDPLFAVKYGNSGFPFAQTSTGFSASTWTHCCAVFSANNSRTIYINGGSSATNTSDQADTTQTLNVLSIAALGRTTPVVFLDGRMAEVGFWNAALTADEVASLAKGFSPKKVRPQSLVTYVPLVRALIDPKGGLSLTNNNGATVASDHPRVYA